MATIQPVIDRQTATFDDGVIRVTWTPVTEADTCAPFSMPAWCERTWQVFGTFGAGGSIAAQGSNDGTNWAAIANRQGVAIAHTAAGISTTQDRPVWVRPAVTAGTGVSVSIVLAVHRQDLAGQAR